MLFTLSATQSHALILQPQPQPRYRIYACPVQVIPVWSVWVPTNNNNATLRICAQQQPMQQSYVHTPIQVSVGNYYLNSFYANKVLQKFMPRGLNRIMQKIELRKRYQRAEPPQLTYQPNPALNFQVELPGSQKKLYLERNANYEIVRLLSYLKRPIYNKKLHIPFKIHSGTVLNNDQTIQLWEAFVQNRIANVRISLRQQYLDILFLAVNALDRYISSPSNTVDDIVRLLMTALPFISTQTRQKLYLEPLWKAFYKICYEKNSLDASLARRYSDLLEDLQIFGADRPKHKNLADFRVQMLAKLAIPSRNNQSR